MMTNDHVYEQLYLNQFEADKEWQGLVEIAKEYHERCDAFDQALGPCKPHNLSAMNKHALQVRRELVKKHGLEGNDKFQEAIIQVSRRIDYDGPGDQ